MRPHDGQERLLRLSSSMFFARPTRIISQAMPATTAIEIVMCMSGVIVLPFSLPPGVGVGLEVQLATPPVGYVRVELGRP